MNVQKAFALTDAKIQFISLVDKAANQKKFLITKSKDGSHNFTTYGRIVKKDEVNHYLTGIVYEPMVEDAQGEYMTEEEITKAAYWFAKNGDKVDIQHSFEAISSAAVVENWVAKANFTIGEENIVKGTWLMTVEITDNEVWEAVQKGKITGFSMSGIGSHSREDINLNNINKSTVDISTDKKGVFKKLASILGFDVVEKGILIDKFNKKSKTTLFWEAFHVLENLLYNYDYISDDWALEDNETVIKEVLLDFTQIVQSILTNEQSILDIIKNDNSIVKAGKKMSDKNKETLKDIYDKLGVFLNEFTEETEDENMTKLEIQKIIEQTIAKTNSSIIEPKPSAEPTEHSVEYIQKMIDESIQKALNPKEPPTPPEDIQTIVANAVAKAIEPVLKSRGVPNHLSEANNIEKSNETHYLAGVL